MRKKVGGSTGEVEGEDGMFQKRGTKAVFIGFLLGPWPVQSQTFKHLAVLAICPNSQGKT